MEACGFNSDWLWHKTPDFLLENQGQLLEFCQFLLRTTQPRQKGEETEEERGREADERERKGRQGGHDLVLIFAHWKALGIRQEVAVFDLIIAVFLRR